MALYDEMLALNVPSEATVYLQTHHTSASTTLPSTCKGKQTYEFPAQELPLGGPATTSQYVPAGSPLWNVVLQVEPSLLIATKATLPREKAICCEEGETQFAIAGEDAACTVLRKPTMPTTAGQRCWHSLEG